MHIDNFQYGHTKSSKHNGQQFGNECTNYTIGRKGYCDELYQYLHQFIKPKDLILDIGCGTGIATIALRSSGFDNICGCDIDKVMLEEAERNSIRQGLDIQYKLAAAYDLTHSFPKGSFQAVTAFSSFHWFCYPQEINEIRSILNTNGFFVVVNKDDTSKFRGEFNQFLEGELGHPVLKDKDKYHPKSILMANNFDIIGEQKWDVDEIYNFDEGVAYCQSLSVWTMLDQQQKTNILPQLRKFVLDRMSNQMMHRPVKISCIVSKPA